MKKILLAMACAVTLCAAATPPTALDSLASRVTEGTSVGRIHFRPLEGGAERYEISRVGDGVEIAGSTPVAMAVGLNRYLKDVARIHIAWNNLSQPLPEPLPLPDTTLCGATDMPYRYYLNYCTFSYSMPFWDEERWMKEIDWMALHGINMPLSIVGAEAVWRNVLTRLGYSREEIGSFLAGPAYTAWWQMNNLEGWGGPVSDEWLDRQEQLQKAIVARMRSLGIEPVLPGYSGMVPRTAGERLGIDVADPGLWCGFKRPAFLLPSDPAFPRIAHIYYEELAKLYGTSRYYSMDPFHEGGNTKGVDLPAVGAAVMRSMKEAAPDAKWVIQAWQAAPRPQMIDTLDRGDLIVLDLYSEKRPQWGDPNSTWYRPDGFQGHDWVYCMLGNFGGNVGMHGDMERLVDGYFKARQSAAAPTLKGVGATPEGIENNPMMFELLFELPWMESKPELHAWLRRYLHARYGAEPSDSLLAAWDNLYATVYNYPASYPGEGTVESVICARPEWDVKSASSWGCSQLPYDASLTRRAAELMAGQGSGNNFDYDYCDVVRQANADEANAMLATMSALMRKGRRDQAQRLSRRFLDLIARQDSLLQQRADTRVDTWLTRAARAATSPAQRRQNVLNAAQLITVWGDEHAANKGGLRDYAHREWGGLIRDLYLRRWQAFFDAQFNAAPTPDYYQLELDWITTTLDTSFTSDK